MDEQLDKDFRFIKEKYEKLEFMSLKEINAIMGMLIIAGKKPSLLTAIIVSLVMSAFLSLAKIRQSKKEEELVEARQGYQRRKAKENKSDLAGDDLDSA